MKGEPGQHYFSYLARRAAASPGRRPLIANIIGFYSGPGFFLSDVPCTASRGTDTYMGHVAEGTTAIATGHFPYWLPLPRAPLPRSPLERSGKRLDRIVAFPSPIARVDLVSLWSTAAETIRLLLEYVAPPSSLDCSRIWRSLALRWIGVSALMLLRFTASKRIIILSLILVPAKPLCWFRWRRISDVNVWFENT